MRTLAPLLTIALFLSAAACDGGGDDAAVRGATATFAHGVASGDVTDDSAVLWTRAEGGDRVTVEIAASDAFDDARTIAAETSAERDFTVKARVDNLEPATRYRYRFRAGDAVSEPGQFVTAPEPSDVAPLRFVFSGDSDGSRRPDGSPPYNEFQVLTAAAAQEPAFFLYFGDTIYADRAPNATTLDGYRGKYRENRGYAALRDIFARTSTYNAWDDHEVVNDFAGTTVDRAMFDAGLRAFREYMPIDGDDDPARMYRAFRWGAAAEIIMLDERSFRSASAAEACAVDGNPDPIPGVLAPGVPDTVRGLRGFVGLPAELPAGCEGEIDDASRTLLGAEQLAWLKERLRDSDATWKIVVNPVPVQALLALPYDRWEGYAAERRELLEFIRDEDIRNVVFLATDFHSNIFGPVRIDPFDGAAPVAYEAVVGPIATATLRRDIVDVLGEGAAGVLDSFFTGIVGVDCAQLDAYAYGMVDIDPPAGTLTVRALDEAGGELCIKELEAR